MLDAANIRRMDFRCALVFAALIADLNWRACISSIVPAILVQSFLGSKKGTALVTGASGVICSEAAARLGATGYDVIIACRPGAESRCRKKMITFLPRTHKALKRPGALASHFSACKKCIFHFCTIRLKPVASQVFAAPIFLEAPNLWVRCSRLLAPNL